MSLLQAKLFYESDKKLDVNFWLRDNSALINYNEVYSYWL